MVGVISTEIAQSFLLNKFTAEEILNYINKRDWLSIRIVEEGKYKQIELTNRLWVNEIHRIGPSYVASEWSNYEIYQDTARQVANKLGLFKEIVITKKGEPPL